jgi:hypothetical protein
VTALETVIFATITALMLAGTLVLSDPDNRLAVALKHEQPVQYLLQSCSP